MLSKFCQLQKPIFISLSPNVEKDDIRLALKLIFQPWRWKKGKAIKLLEEKLKKYLGINYAFCFNSGRSAFLAILQGLGLEEGNEVLLQAFTCNAAVNPIIWSNLKPVFVDIERETLNIDPKDLEKKITKKTRAVLVQHTFGLPAKIDEIQEICQRHNLILIEDCAHSLGAKYQGRSVGQFGKASFFSFGRDKVISSVYGGMAVTNDPVLAEKIKKFQQNCSYPSCFWIFQQLLHPILTKDLVMPLYGFWGLGRWLLLILQKIRVLSKAVQKIEKRGKKPDFFPKKMPEALAILALNQLKKLDKFNIHRQKIAVSYYHKLENQGFLLPHRDFERIYMRYSVLMDGGDTDRILKKARKQKILLDDGWRKTPIVPPNTSQEKMGYKWGSCPWAEKAAKEILNLPTHINISLKDSKRIIDFLRNVKESAKPLPC